MKIIAITGKARSGKDSIAKRLVMHHGYTRIAFADPLKLAAQHVFGLTEDQTWNDDLKEVVIPFWSMTPRQIFQNFGTEAVKGTFGVDTWVKRFRLSLDMVEGTDNIVVPDCRCDIEAEALRRLGAIIVEVQRGTGLNGSVGDHASELGLSTLPDVSIDNRGSIEDLWKQVDMLVGGAK